MLQDAGKLDTHLQHVFDAVVSKGNIFWHGLCMHLKRSIAPAITPEEFQLSTTKTLLSAVAAIAMTSATACVNAAPVVVDFEGVVADDGRTIPATPYIEDGFTLTNTLPAGNNDAIFGKSFGVNANGSAIFVLCSFDSGCANGTSILLTGPTPFSLQSIDVAISDIRDLPGTIELIGSLLGGGTVTATLNTVAAWSTNALAGFSNLTSVEFRGHTTYAVAIDNLTLSTSPVPEPGSLALLGLGLTGLFAARRNRA